MAPSGDGGAPPHRPSVGKVTSWAPGGGDAEVISHGADGPSSRRSHLVAAAAVLLLGGAATGGGVVAGYQDQLPWVGQAADVPALTAGGIVAASNEEDRHRYQLSLYNPGPGVIPDVQVVGVVGRAVTVLGDEPVDLEPHSWRTVYFWLPDECGSPAGAPVRSIRVRTGRTAEGEPAAEREVVLGEPADALRTHRHDECLEPTALSAWDLGGLWTLTRVEGTWTGLAGYSLMRFTSDGRFAFDPEGRMFHDGRQGWFGTYRLHGTRLLLRGTGGYSCAAGYSETWTTTLLDPRVLQLDNIRADPGYCYTPPGERWTLHLLVPEPDLPPPDQYRPLSRRAATGPAADSTQIVSRPRR